jgi:hypothetical protein
MPWTCLSQRGSSGGGARGRWYARLDGDGFRACHWCYVERYPKHDRGYELDLLS